MGDSFILPIGVVVVISLIGLAIYGAIADEQNWSKFAAEHRCKVIGEIASSTSVGVGVGGAATVVPVYTPGKIGYQCDDNKQYWR